MSTSTTTQTPATSTPAAPAPATPAQTTPGPATQSSTTHTPTTRVKRTHADMENAPENPENAEQSHIDIDTPDNTPTGFAPNPPINTLLPVPKPEGSFPCIHGLTEKDLFAHVHPDTLNAWRKQSGPYIFAYLANDKIVTEASSRVARIRELIRSFFDCPDLVVRHAKPTKLRSLDYKPVSPYFIGGLTSFQVDRLVERGCWSLPTITIFFIPAVLPISPFVMTLGNLPLEPTPANNAKVAETVKAKIVSSRPLHSFINHHRDNLPKALNGPGVVQYVVDSVQIKGFLLRERGDNIPVFNVYIHSPSTNPTTNDLWVQKLRLLTYTCIEGTGEARELFHCNDCKGRDHPSGLCPYKAIPGWHRNDMLTTADERDEDDGRRGRNDTGTRGSRAGRGTSRGQGCRGGLRGRNTCT